MGEGYRSQEPESRRRLGAVAYDMAQAGRSRAAVQRMGLMRPMGLMSKLLVVAALEDEARVSGNGWVV